MYRKILLAVDGSNSSEWAIREACQLVKALGAQLKVINVVIESAADACHAPSVYHDRLIASLRADGLKALAHAAAILREEGVSFEEHLVETIGGHVAAEIVRQAINCRADLIVMGTHGTSALRRRALGSEAERVIHAAPVPVLLARDRRHEEDPVAA
ncbi:MAG: universal stress protein [Steroidobacteraceae bacterium]